jgi:ribonuclease P protein component
LRLTPLVTLKKPSEFKTVRDAGLSWHTPHFILSRRPREDDIRSLGLILTKKIGNAVVRNRIKRRLRVLAREILPREAVPGDYVFIGKAACLDAAPETLKKDVLWALKRLSCLASSSD